MARPRSSAAAATRRPAQVQSKDRATSSVAARRAVLKRIKDEGVEHVLFWFTDLEGHLKSFAITPSEMEGALDDGMGFDGSSITGFNRIEESDMVAIPDPATFQIMPRPVDDHGHELGSKVGRMICDVVKPDGTPYEGDPRYILKLALERMQKLGFDTFNVGPELEYFLFEDDKGTETIDEGGYFAMTVQDAATEVRNDTIAALESVGIQIEYHHHEVAPVAARDRHALRRRARDGRQDDDLPDRRQGGRCLARVLRDVHAEAAVRRERLGHAHPHVAVQGRAQPVLRRQGPEPPLRDGEVVHRRPARARARAVGRAGAVGELVQAARAGLRGAGLRRLVAAQPLGPDQDPALQAGLRAGDEGRDPLPRPRLQPVPRVRGVAPRGPRGDREGLQAARPR